MNNVIFARPRQDYGSYRDFWRVVELSQFPMCYLDEIDWSLGNQTVIATPKNAEWSAIPDRHNSRLVWWTIERNSNTTDALDMSNPHVPRCVDEVWTSDRSIARKQGWKYVFLGGHRMFSDVALPIHWIKQYDIITLMAPMPRRARLFEELKVFSNADTGNLWGEERNKRLGDSRLMIMCHQDDQPICEPPRMMIGGCYALPMLCERSADSGYWIESTHYLAVSLDKLARTAQLIIDNEALLARIGMAAWRLVCIERPFAQEVQAAL